MPSKPEPTAADIEAAFEADITKVQQNELCNVGKIIKFNPNGELIAAKIADESIAGTMISRVLKSLGITPTISADVISKHRRGLCRCPKETK